MIKFLKIQKLQKKGSKVLMNREPNIPKIRGNSWKIEYLWLLMKRLNINFKKLLELNKNSKEEDYNPQTWQINQKMRNNN